MRLTVGKSTDADPGRAVSEAVQTALAEAGQPAFALVLTTDRSDIRGFAAAVSEALGFVPWAGGSAAAVIANGELLLAGVAVGILSSDALEVGIGIGGPLRENPAGAGARATAEAMRGTRPGAERTRLLLVFTDARSGRVDEVVTGVIAESGAGSTWAGGALGDNLDRSHPAELALGAAYEDHVIVVSLDEGTKPSVAIGHGWRPYGPPTMVTGARGSLVSELEYEDAFSVYRRTVRSLTAELAQDGFATFAMTHPLGIPQADGEFVIRDPLAVALDGSLRCVGAIPDGCLVRIMQGERAELVAAARRTAQAARRGIEGDVGGAFVFDCVSRHLVLGPGFGEELAAIDAALGAPSIGCLTFGEVGALGRGVPQFHNKATVVVALPGGRAA